MSVCLSVCVPCAVHQQHQCALEVIAEQQELREQRYNAVATVGAMAGAGAGDGSSSRGSSGSCSRSCSAAEIPQAVQQQLDFMLDAAKTVGKGLRLESRLILSQVMCHQGVPVQQQQQSCAPPVPSEQQQEHEQDDKDVVSEEGCTAAIIEAEEALAEPAAVSKAGAAAGVEARGMAVGVQAL